MSDTALKVLNALPGSEKKNEGSSKQCFLKPQVEITNEKFKDVQGKIPLSLVSQHSNGNEIVNGVDVGNSEVEYIESENLNDLEDVDTSLKALLAGLGSKNWVLVCEALNDVRRLSIYHREAMCDILGDVILLVVKSLKNPRSAVCKTAIMTSADLFNAYNDLIIGSLEPMLVQLLLKSSQDKRFVCEAAERALIAMITCISPAVLLPKLQPFLKNKNPRVRAKASVCFSRSVSQMGVEGISTYGIDKLIQVAASQLSDQLPESREAARTLLLDLQIVHEKCYIPTPDTVSDDQELNSWEHFCQSKLSPLSAQAVLRVTSVAREGLALGS